MRRKKIKRKVKKIKKRLKKRKSMRKKKSNILIWMVVAAAIITASATMAKDKQLKVSE